MAGSTAAPPSASEPLFTLPIAPSGSITAAGTLTCTAHSSTASAGNIYLLTFHSPPDNRLTAPFCQALLLALDIIQLRHPPGVVVTTSAISKFYSNGLDFENVKSDETFYRESLWPLFRRLVTYPMPTIALLKGHAFAAGLMLAMHHDYRLFNPSRGFLCLNELEFGASLHPPMASIFRAKLPSPRTFRDLVLEAKRFKGPDALAEGLVDALGVEWEDLTRFVGERGLMGKAAKGSYGLLKAELWRESVADLDGLSKAQTVERHQETERAAAQSRARVASWEKSRDRAKI